MSFRNAMISKDAQDRIQLMKLDLDRKLFLLEASISPGVALNSFINQPVAKKAQVETDEEMSIKANLIKQKIRMEAKPDPLRIKEELKLQVVPV